MSGLVEVSCYIIILLFIFSFNLTGLILGVTHNNATCYENKNIISLSDWLISTTSIATLSQICQLIFLYVINNTLKMPLAIFIVLSSVFSFIMAIIGIIELGYQYPTCKSEVLSIGVMIIIILIINLTGLFSSKNTLIYKKKHGEYIEIESNI